MGLLTIPKCNTSSCMQKYTSGRFWRYINETSSSYQGNVCQRFKIKEEQNVQSSKESSEATWKPHKKLELMRFKIYGHAYSDICMRANMPATVYAGVHVSLLCLCIYLSASMYIPLFTQWKCVLCEFIRVFVRLSTPAPQRHGMVLG